MNGTVKIICDNNDCHITVSRGTALADVITILSLRNPHPFLAALVNNKYRELDYAVYEPCTVRFIDITHFEGMRVYQRTLFFTLSKAVRDLYPGCTFRVRHAVSKGFYCEIDGRPEITQEEIDALKRRMHELIAQDIPIIKEKMLHTEAEAVYTKLGYADKLALIRSRPSLYVTVYQLADIAGNMFGVTATSTGVLHLFDICRYYNGFYLAIPMRTDPARLETMVPQDKMFEIFKEYKAWVDVIGVSNIGSLNQKIIEGGASELIRIAEAFHEKKLGWIADRIAEANAEHGARMVLISGPSSSGKTTFAKRVGIQLRILGLDPVLISLDDYFVERDKTPRDEHGDYDYESLYALDLETFNEHLKILFEGGSVDVPRYDFITGRREFHERPLQLTSRSVLVIEGIHGLNPELTQEIDDKYKFRIYISALTSISLDDISRIATTDNRLLRRITRDYYTRGADATATLKRWPSVRAGEDKHIFPYQENADVMFNSSLYYEISVLRRYVEPMLHEVTDLVPEYAEAQRLLKFLDNFIPISPEEIPPTSILREFIGGSSFKY
ncbi:MAG: nucleoside kinase [Rikenellaceae bacterium]|nr:nucleoside kinase [Rikenellaceae bacterium]MCL2692554.1 nucleoside kinase [Rikenellaceae bacterium]